MNNSTLDFIKQIIDKQMNMPVNRVWAYNGNNDLPKDAGLFIILSFRDKSVYANNVKYIPTETGYQEIQALNMAEDILISCISQNTEARDRCHEVSMALTSMYSQEIQEKNHIHISTTGEILENSFLEETSNLNRFDIECRVLRAYDKINNVDYYDKFPNTSTFEPEWHIN